MLATTIDNAFSCSLQSVKESLAAIDRFSIQAAEELREIRDSQIFNEGGYKTFEEFCDRELLEWGGYRRVNQLLGFSQVTSILKGTEFDGIVKRESHARPLLRLVKTPDNLLETVAIACLASSTPTAKDFAEAVKQVSPLPHKKPKVQEQLFLRGTKVKVSSYGHLRFEQEGAIAGDAPNSYQQLVSFDGEEERELINNSDLVVATTPIERNTAPPPQTYTEEQLRMAIARAIEESKIGYKVEMEERAKAQVREQLIASQSLASDKALEVAKLQQTIEELQSLRLLEVENQRLQQQIGELERALEKRPVQEWGNTLTKQAEKAININTIKAVEALEPDLHLRALAIAPPNDATEALRLMTLAIGNMAQAIGSTQLLSAAGILLKCHPTSEAISYQVELNLMVHQAVGDIRKELQRGCNWQGFWAIACEYEAIKKAYWRELTQDEKNLITLLKQEFDEKGRGQEIESLPSPLFPLPSSFVPGTAIAHSDKYSELYVKNGVVVEEINAEEVFVVWSHDAEQKPKRYFKTKLRILEVVKNA